VYHGRAGSPSRPFNPKTETDLTADYADYRDTRGYDYQCPEVLPQKIRALIPDNFLKICEISEGICGFKLRNLGSKEADS
jgi:hypothetical protein